MFFGWLLKMKRVWENQVHMFLLQRQKKRFILLVTNFSQEKQVFCWRAIFMWYYGLIGSCVATFFGLLNTVYHNLK